MPHVFGLSGIIGPSDATASQSRVHNMGLQDFRGESLTRNRCEPEQLGVIVQIR